MNNEFFSWAWPNDAWTRWQRCLGALSAVALVFSIIYAKHEFGIGFSKCDPVKMRQAIILAFWIVAPPVWFWFEYFFLYAKAPAPKPDIEHFKHGQDQSSKIWLALVTLLLGMYFGHDLIRDSSPEPSDKNHAVESQKSQQVPQCAPSGGAPSSSPQAKVLH